MFAIDIPIIAGFKNQSSYCCTRAGVNLEAHEGPGFPKFLVLAGGKREVQKRIVKA